MGSLRTRIRRYRESVDFTWDQPDAPPQARSRYCLFDGYGPTVPDPEEEYAALKLLGPLATKVLQEDVITQWSTIDIVREMRARKLDLIKNDARIAKLILAADRAAFGNRGHNGAR